MQGDVRITAVIPTYNRGHVVGRAIESALAQEYPPSEIIIIDDGSLDNTRNIIDSYGERVRCVYQTNGGVSSARNRGVREAKFEWIAFLDSDDYWLREHLKRMVNAIEATHGEAALYFTDTQLPEGEDGHSLWHACEFEIKKEWEFKRDAGEWALRRIQPMMLQSSVISRTAYLEIGGLPEQLRTREDTLLFFKLALLYAACAVSGCGTVMNSDGNIRLTQLYNAESHDYCHATILVYEELLASTKNIGRARRQFFRSSLGASYLGLSRMFFRQKKYLSAIKNLAVSCFVSPLRFVEELSASLARRVSRAAGVKGVSHTSLPPSGESSITTSRDQCHHDRGATVKGE
jgi:glycosyltransferase involved in cell wall biosynthesis